MARRPRYTLESALPCVLVLMIRSAHRAFALSVVVSCALFGRSARAQSADVSCEAVERTESLREGGGYREARARLLECVNAQCGGDVRRRCATTLQKLDAVTPSIVVRADDGNGNDVLDVAVSLGDEPLMSSLDGMAVPVDPGEHRFVFSRSGYEPVTRTLTINQGEKFRAIDVSIGSGPAPAAPLELGASRPASMSSARLAGGISLIGVGVVGLAGFTWLGLKARSREESLQRQNCKPFCDEGLVDSLETRYVLANVSLGVGVLSLGAATWLLLSGWSSGDVAQPVDAGVAVGADADSAFASYSGRF